MTTIIRKAEASDLDALAEITIATIKGDAIRSYRYCYAESYPEDHQIFVRRRFADWLEDASTGGAFRIVVAETPDKVTPEIRRVVGFAIWQMPGFHIASDGAASDHRKPQTHQRRDVSETRKKIYKQRFKHAKEEFFFPRYGEQQLNLVQLAIQPEYQRQGLGTRLTKWGIENATHGGVAITLFTHAKGRLLYKNLGFREIGVVHLPLEDGVKMIECFAMANEDSFQAST